MIPTYAKFPVRLMIIAYIVIIALVLVVGLFVFSKFASIKQKAVKFNGTDTISNKDREAILKNINRRLASNPKDGAALSTLAELYYKDGDYTKAMRTYQVLLAQGSKASGSILDESTLSLHYGISAMHSKIWSEAYNALMLCRSRMPESFEVNLSLGKVEFYRKNYIRSANFLKKALRMSPVDSETHKFLGMCMYETKRFNEATSHLKHAVKEQRSDLELRYTYARCEYESSRLDSAHSFFKPLIADPKWGANSALYSGNIFVKKQEWEAAINDYESGLRHKNIPVELSLELKYCLAEAYSKANEVNKALSLYNEVFAISPSYKDIEFRIIQHRELNSNKNFQIYLRASGNEFTALIHEIAKAVFPKATIKVTDVSFLQNDYVDLLAEVKTKKREEIALFRFMRIEGHVGELFVRDFHGKLKELHADCGFFFAPGQFSIEATHFVEARLIELWDKARLLKVLKTLNTSVIKSSKTK